MRREKTYFIDSLIFAALACLLAFLCKPVDGLMLTHDSLAYIHASETFLNGQGYLYFGYSTPMVQWPLLMPTLLGVLSLAGNATAIMEVLNILFFGVTVFFGSMSVSRLIKDRTVCALAMAVMTFSLSYVKPFYYLLSESVFLMLLSILLYLFLVWTSRGSTGSLIGMSVTAGLLMWTRFTGLELAGLIGIYVLFFTGKSLSKRIKEASVYAGIAALPYLGLLIRNYLYSGTFTGRSKPSVTPFLKNIKDTIKTMGGWFLPQNPAAGAVILAVIALLCCYSAYLIFKKRPLDARSGRAGISVFIVHTLVYPLTVIYSNTFYALDPIGNRVLAPMFLTAVVSIFWLADEALARVEKRVLRSAALVSMAALSIVIVVSNSVALFSEGPNYKGYYREENFSADPMLDYIKSIPEDIKIYTNKPGDVYFATKKDSNYPPRREGARIYLKDACDERLLKSGKELYIVWYNVSTNPVVYQRDELVSMYSCELVEEFPNGWIYKADMTGIDR